MHKARAFFYVCAGVFLLALSYHLGARNATAQAHALLVGVTRISDGAGSPYAAVDAAGTVYVESSGGWIVAGHIPVRPVSLSTDYVSTGGLIVGTESGDIYVSSNTSPPVFTFHGNVFGGGPTPAQRESFGAVKSRYRGERGAVRPAARDR